MKNLKTVMLLMLIFITFRAEATSEFNESEKLNLFLKANDAYTKQDYQSAKSGYEQLAASGIKNGHLFYNLGNTYLKLNNNGKALAYYLKAKKLIPHDPDLTANIAYLKNKTGNETENSATGNIWKKVLVWYEVLNFKQFIISFLIFWTLLWTLLIIRIFFPADIIKTVIPAYGLMFIIFTLSFLYRVYEETEKKVVVISAEAEIKAGTDINSPTVFRAPEGTVLKVISATDRWNKVVSGENRRGWLQKASVEEI